MNFATLVTDCEPVSKAEAAAAVAGPAPAPSAPAVAVSPPAAPPPVSPPVFLPGRARSAAIPLEFPLGYAGKTYAAIVLRRPTAGEVGTYMDGLRLGAELMLPIFYHEDGEPVPLAVLAMLDADDDETIWGRVADFLPRRLRLLLDQVASGSLPAAGASAAPTSSL